MSEIGERAAQVRSDDLVAMTAVVQPIRSDAESLPDQIAAASAVKRSLDALSHGPTSMKAEVLRLRWEKLLRTL